jgi:predicted transcriptional regulator
MKRTAMNLCRKMVAMLNRKQEELDRRQRELDAQRDRLLKSCRTSKKSVEEHMDNIARETGLKVVHTQLRRK